MAKPSPSKGNAAALQQLLEGAVGAHRQGRLEEAEGLYQQALQRQPGLFEAQHLLGVLRGQQGRYEEALLLVAAALEARPDAVGALANYGLILHKLGRHAEALTSFDRALAIRSDNSEALSNRGNALAALGRHAEALASYDRALAARPDYPEALNNRGLALQALGRPEEALKSCVKALLIRPDYAEAHYNRGNLLARLARYEEALRSYDAATALKPDYTQAYDNRGNALAELARYEEALASYDRALAIDPHYAGAWNNRGIVLEQMRQCEAALASYDQALRLKPGYSAALGNRGNVLSKLKCYEQAIAAYDQALAIEGDDADVLYNRGNALAALRRYDLAAESYEQVLKIAPNDDNALGGLIGARLATCDWHDLEDLRRQLAEHVHDGRSTIGPFALLTTWDDPELLLRCAKEFVKQQARVTVQSHANKSRAPHERIRVAYVSGDFRTHVMAYQLAELFELHDRAAFEIIGVSLSADDGSDIRKRLVGAFDQSIDAAAVADEDVARLLRELEVDIAVDLMGHTRDARLPIFAHRPAPIQVSYLGYAGTTGAEFIDYIVGDPMVLPADQQPYYTEQIVQLPETFFVNDATRARASRLPRRPEAGLPERGFVYACFNNPAKIQPAMFDIWMRLLRGVVGSVLWLSPRNSVAQANLRREAQIRGVDPDRLIFAERVPQMNDHLARVALADLFLDTLPYNAHATASDALWAGLPVLTCCGKSFAARVGASLVRAAGLPELVTESLADYEALALRLAGDPVEIGLARSKLAQGRGQSPLFDTRRYCRHLERAYRVMWDKWQQGEPTQGFCVPASD